MHSLKRALQVLHQEHHVPHVVISSMPLKPFLQDALPSTIWPVSQLGDEEQADDFLLCLSSSHIPEDDAQRNPAEISAIHAHCIPSIPGYFSGVGDFFSALVLAHFNPASPLTSDSARDATPRNHTPLSFAVSQALTKTYAILRLTHDHALALPKDDRTQTDEEKDSAEPERKIRRMKGRELRIVQGQDIIRGHQHVNARDMTRWDRFWEG